MRTFVHLLVGAAIASQSKHRSGAVVLKKSKRWSGATAFFQPGEASFGAGAPASAVFGFFLSPIVMLLMAGALLLALLLATPSGLHAATLAHGSVTQPAVEFCVPLLAGSLATQLKEAEDKVVAKSKELHDIFESGGVDRDFNKPECLKAAGATDSAGVVAKVKALNNELTDLGKKRDEASELLSIEEKAKGHVKRGNEPRFRPPLPDGNGGDPERKGRGFKQLGTLIVHSQAYKDYRTNSANGTKQELDDEEFGIDNIKATFQTSAGWAPESLRLPGFIEKAQRPIQILDLIPTSPTTQAAIPFMEETTRTHNANERNEGAAYTEDAFAFTQQSSNVRSIGTSIPVTDEQLEDVPQVEGYLNQRLVFSCRIRLDAQVLNGDGAAPNLRGINNVAGIQTQAKGADPTPDAVYKAMQKIRVTGRAIPNAIVMHPDDWTDIRLLRTADGIYIWGSPSEAGPERLWSVQVTQSDAQASGTGLVGDFLNFCHLFERRGVIVEIGYVNAQFGAGTKTIRAGFRVAFVVFRAAAFCQVTGI